MSSTTSIISLPSYQSLDGKKAMNFSSFRLSSRGKKKRDNKGRREEFKLVSPCFVEGWISCSALDGGLGVEVVFSRKISLKINKCC